MARNSMTCTYCGKPEREHIPITPPDDPLAGQSLLICPTAIYQPAARGHRRWVETRRAS